MLNFRRMVVAVFCGAATSVSLLSAAAANPADNTNATCCPTAQAARNLAQIRWHLLRTWLGGGAGDLIFVSAGDMARLHAAYKRYLSQFKACREEGIQPQKRVTGRPYAHMWLMVSAPLGDSRIVRVWDAATPAPTGGPAPGNSATHVYLVPQVLHRRPVAPQHCLVLASPGRWRLLRIKR